MTPGQRYTRLVSIKPHEDDRPGRRRWYFECDCGSMIDSLVASVRIRDTQSCGCLHRENAARTIADATRTHGMSKTPMYSHWARMIQRCSDPNHDKFHRYGGRGITVCERWLKFENFYADMGLKPSPKHSIDRINNDGPYSPENCRWATQKEQMRNTSTNRYIIFNGKRMTVAEAVEITGLSYSKVLTRLNLGWSVERALSS